MAFPRANYDRTRHAAVRTSDYLFNQLIPYIGNQRKLLRLIHKAVKQTDASPGATFVDFFAGSGVVSRWAKRLGYRVVANDWEPYARGHQPVLHRLQPAAGDCRPGRIPASDRAAQPPAAEGRMGDGAPLSPRRRPFRRRAATACSTCAKMACGSTPFASRSRPGKTPGKSRRSKRRACWRRCSIKPVTPATPAASSRGFTMVGAARRARRCIASPATCGSACPCSGIMPFRTRCSARMPRCLARRLSDEEIDIAYLDPPYNQHPYGSNYHVLNSVALWDKPALSRQITPGHEGGHPHRLAHRAPQRLQLPRRGEPGLRTTARHASAPDTFSPATAPTA